MKHLFRLILIHFSTVFLAYSFLPSVSVPSSDPLVIGKTLALVALGLYLFNLIVRPVINLLILPINLLTLGTFRWVISVLALFVVTRFVPMFVIHPFNFSGVDFGAITLPAFALGKIGSLVVTSLSISAVSGLLTWFLD